MRIFVACWFFPPSVSSEGIVTYKLLRNSKHSYDVCSSLSQQWSYQNAQLSCDADNITCLTVDTDDLNEWVDECVRLFEERHAIEPYDAVMTRSMPPESIEVGRRIHEAHPDVPWIASLADPIAKSPYDLQKWVIETEDMSENMKRELMEALKNGTDAWRDSDRPAIRSLCEFKDVEDSAINNATALIFPHEALRRYVLGSRRRKNAFVVHHSFDKSLYPVKQPCQRDRVRLTFTGHSDAVRTLEPLVRALHRAQAIDESIADKLDIQLIGHVTKEVRSIIYNYDLYDCITITPDAGYLDTLDAMVDSDWLLHVDAYFDFLADEGGSVFFAGKIADYLGTDKPILAITGAHSPAYEIIERAGGLCYEPSDIAGLAQALVNIADGVAPFAIDKDYRARYDAVAIAASFDTWVDELLSKDEVPFTRSAWPTVPEEGTCKQKFISICVPAYNVASYLDRCLYSLVSCPAADQLEIIVVDDGSPDNSAQIALAYQQRYPSIVKVIRKENGGHGSTINAALAIAQGIYFRIVDGDDWVDGKSLDTLVGKLRKLEALPDLVSTNYQRVFAESGKTDDWVKVSPDLQDYVLYDFATTDLSTEYFTMASMMVKTELLRALDFKLQEHTYYVDVEYLLFAIPYIETVMFTPEFLYRYAVGNADQSINPSVFISRYDHHDRVIRRMVTYYAERVDTMGEGQRNYMKSLFVRHLLNTQYLLSLVWDPDKQRGYERAKDFDAYLKETAPDLYAEYGKKHPVVIAIRATGFNPSIKLRPADTEPPNIGGVLYDAAHIIARNPYGYKIVHNDMLRSIAMKFVR